MDEALLESSEYVATDAVQQPYADDATVAAIDLANQKCGRQRGVSNQ